MHLHILDPHERIDSDVRGVEISVPNSAYPSYTDERGGMMGEGMRRSTQDVVVSTFAWMEDAVQVVRVNPDEINSVIEVRAEKILRLLVLC